MADADGKIMMRTSAAEAVTSQMRKELLNGTIPAGSRILAKDLAERFQVSIVPVREAIMRLETEGLLVSSPQRATFAAEIGLDDITGVYDLRRIVEVELAGRAALVADDDAHKKCRAALDHLLDAETHSAVFYEAHRQFHWYLLEPAASAISKSVLERLWLNVDRYMSFAARNVATYNSAAYREEFAKSHRDLAAAFEAGQADHLKKLLSAHLSDTETALKAAYTEITQEKL